MLANNGIASLVTNLASLENKEMKIGIRLNML